MRTIQDIAASFRPWAGELPPLGHAVIQAYRYANQKKTQQLVVVHNQSVPYPRGLMEALGNQQAGRAPFTFKDHRKPRSIGWDGEARQLLDRAPSQVGIIGPYADADELYILLNRQLNEAELDTILGFTPAPVAPPAPALPAPVVPFDPFDLADPANPEVKTAVTPDGTIHLEFA